MYAVSDILWHGQFQKRKKKVRVDGYTAARYGYTVASYIVPPLFPGGIPRKKNNTADRVDKAHIRT